MSRHIITEEEKPDMATMEFKNLIAGSHGKGSDKDIHACYRISTGKLIFTVQNHGETTEFNDLDSAVEFYNSKP